MTELAEIRSCLADGEQLKLSNLVEAGELIYINKKFVDIMKGIIDDYRRHNESYPFLINSLFTPILYQLKRHQNLDDFLRTFLAEFPLAFPDSTLPYEFSLRRILHILLLKSDFSLSRKILMLLSKRNAVPFVYPRISSSNSTAEREFVSEIFHVWNFSRPTVLSFGIDDGKNGKSTLLNKLFLSVFEQSTDSIYFESTIDIDFGHNFLTPRATNIADAHGPISRNLLEKIHSLFDGFLVQIPFDYLKNHLDKIRPFLDLIKSNEKYFLLIIRDVQNPAATKQAEEILNENFAEFRRFLLPNVAADNNLSRTKITMLQKEIWENQPMPKDVRPNAETSIKTILRQIVSPEYINLLNRIEQNIAPLEELLSSIARDERISKKYFPQYLLLSQLCKLKSELINSRFCSDGDDARIYRIRTEISQIDKQLKEILQNPNELSALFVKLLRKENQLTCLDLLSTRLRQDRERIVPPGEMAQQLPVHHSLSLEVLWRNAILCSQDSTINNQTSLCKDYFQYIRAGFPFEIVDGDNLNFQYDFLLKTLATLRDQHTLVVSILGPQNSGKSTLLNYMFGTLFDVRNGRCTRGIYGSLIKLNHKHFKQILLLDTEGLFSTERRNEEYERRIVLFCFAVSHVVLINVARDFDTSVQSIISTCADSLDKMGVTRIPRPVLHLILNQQADPNRAARETPTLLQNLRKAISDDNVELNEENCHSLPSAFINEGRTSTSSDGMSSAEKTNPDFLNATQILCQKLFQSLENRSNNSTGAFADILQWLTSSRTIFDVSQEYPDLTHYHHVNERRVDKDVRQYIRESLSKIFTIDYRRQLIDESLDKNGEEIRQLFLMKKQKIEDESIEELQKHLKMLNASPRIRERSENFLRIQIFQHFVALENESTAKIDRKKVREFIDKAKTSTQTLLNDVMDKKDRRSLDTILKNLNGNLSQQKTSIQNQFDAEKCLQNCQKLVYTFYAIYETDFRAELSTISQFFSFLKNQIDAKTPTVYERKIYTDFFQDQRDKSTSLVEFFPFDPKISIYTGEIIKNLRFLNKNLLEKTLRKNPAQLNSDAFLRAVREQMHSEHESSQTTDAQRFFQLTSTFDELLQRVFVGMTGANSNEIRPISPELVQNLINLVNGLFDEIDAELNPFCVKMTRPLKTHFHSCVIILLTKFYFDEQRKYFNETIRQCENYEKEIEDLIRNVVKDDMSVDESHALNFLKNYKKFLVNRVTKESRAIIEQVLHNYKHIDRKYVQNECDDLLLTEKDEKWIDEYLSNPRKIIEERFRRIWTKIESEIDQLIIENKSENTDDLIKCLNSFSNFWRILCEMGEITDAAQNVFELIEGKSSGNAKDLIDKQFCLSILFNRFGTEKNLCDPIRITNRKFVLKNKALRAFQSAQDRRQSLGSKGIEEEKKRIEKDWEKLNLTFRNVDQSDSFNKFRDRVLACSALCPCCRRPCDVDHSLLQSKAGSPLNEHQCKSGHILRAMNGFKFETINEPSLTTCEQIQDDDILFIDSSRYQWANFKALHREWNFESDLNRDELILLQGKFLTLWGKIGPRICQKHQMNFVTHNSKIQKNHESLHYILLLDASGSMVGSRWRDLRIGVHRFINDRMKLRTQDFLTIIVFNDEATFFCQKIRLTTLDLDKLQKPGGQTNFSAAFQLVDQCISSTKKLPPTAVENQYAIIFMTDGEDENFQVEQMKRLSDKHGDVIRRFWTFALTDSPSSLLNLQSINDIMSGTFFDIDQSANLASKYAEVASSRVLVRSS